MSSKFVLAIGHINWLVDTSRNLQVTVAISISACVGGGGVALNDAVIGQFHVNVSLRRGVVKVRGVALQYRVLFGNISVLVERFIVDLN